MNTSKRNQGFSLIELITALSVASILMGTAVPSFIDFVGSSRSASEYRELYTGLQFARSEAITRGETVTVSAKNGANWASGFVIWTDQNGNNTIDAGEEILDAAAFSSKATMTEASETASFSYTSEGFLDAVAGSHFVLSYRTAQNCTWDRDISLVFTGAVSAQKANCAS